MANTRARCIGHDKTRCKESSRLGSEAAEAHADTWQTFTACRVDDEGAGYVSVQRGNTNVTITWDKESLPFAPKIHSRP